MCRYQERPKRTSDGPLRVVEKRGVYARIHPIKTGLNSSPDWLIGPTDQRSIEWSDWLTDRVNGSVGSTFGLGQDLGRVNTQVGSTLGLGQDLGQLDLCSCWHHPMVISENTPVWHGCAWPLRVATPTACVSPWGCMRPRPVTCRSSIFSFW